MSDSRSAYYDDLEKEEAALQAEREKTVEYWRDRCLRVESEMEDIRRSLRVVRNLLS